MPMKYTLPELFKEEKIVLAPEIYDCASANAVSANAVHSSALAAGTSSISAIISSTGYGGFCRYSVNWSSFSSVVFFSIALNRPFMVEVDWIV